ncbi:MAG TPA: tRNA (adenosine(37)-N6)-threonylcarbamoyltransferase complex ATPase subunit type 1 TsaE [Bacteroidales bacterium]
MSSFRHTAHSVSELAAISKSMISEMGDERIFAFEGKMGAGKTTLIKSVCEVLGVEDVVSSPTFSLVNVYNDKDGNNIYHFDFYRIKKLEEVFDIGYEEYFYSGDYCLIEWPEMVKQVMPDSYVLVSIEVDDNENRLISYSLVNQKN